MKRVAMGTPNEFEMRFKVPMEGAMLSRSACEVRLVEIPARLANCEIVKPRFFRIPRIRAPIFMFWVSVSGDLILI